MPQSRLGGTVRERRHAQTVAELKAVALRHLAEGGAGKLSLRAVARDLGVSVQALYHYVDSYDDLVSLLVVDGFVALADAVERAATRSRGASRLDRLVAVTGAYRRWALRHKAQFLLLYGTPLPGYRGPEATVAEARRLAAAFAEVVFGVAADDDLSPAAQRLFLQLRATMHGLVMLEVLGQLGPLPGPAAELMREFCGRTDSELSAAQLPLRSRPAKGAEGE